MLREKIRKKLKSEQGTSIFFGLLLFLVASILSVVMLEGAVTTVKTVASDRESESIELYQCGTGVKRFYYQYKAVRNCYSKKR